MGKGGGIESWECEVCQRRCDCNDGLQRGENFEEFLEEVMRDIRRGANWIENHRVWIEDDVCSNNGKKAEPDMPVCCLHRSHLPCRSRNTGPPCYGCMNYEGCGEEEGSAWSDIRNAVRAAGLPTTPPCSDDEEQEQEQHEAHGMSVPGGFLGAAMFGIAAATVIAAGEQGAAFGRDGGYSGGGGGGGWGGSGGDVYGGGSVLRYDTFAQKSAAAMWREERARQAFDLLRTEVEPAGISAHRELLRPNCHLTAPCYRSFSKYVKAHAGWTVRRRTATEAEKQAHGERRLGKCYFINVTYHPPACPAYSQAGREQGQPANIFPPLPPLPPLAAKRQTYHTEGMSSARNVRPRVGDDNMARASAENGFHGACRGLHWVSGGGGCQNEACRGLAKCVASCRGCPDAVPLLGVCQGTHSVSGGCKNEACRRRDKCVASCRGCPDRPENRPAGCTVM